MEYAGVKTSRLTGYDNYQNLDEGYSLRASAMKVKKSTDCGNSPKNDFVQSLCIALMKADIDLLSHSAAEDVVWVVGSEEPVVGISKFLDAVRRRNRKRKLTLTILHVVSHGKIGAANGNLRLQTGAGFNFCHVFEFTSAAARSIKRIHSYGMVD